MIWFGFSHPNFREFFVLTSCSSLNGILFCFSRFVRCSTRGVDVQVVDRLGYSADAVNWADVIFTAGGDGTFLLGAHKIRTRDKPIIGLNTDPDL